MNQQQEEMHSRPRVQTFTTRRAGINLVIPDHAQQRLVERRGRLGNVLRHMARLVNEPPGQVAIISTLDVVPIVRVQRSQAVLKTVLAHDQPVWPGTRLVEVYL
jgi:hypothetical protein